MAYSKQTWENLPNQTTPITAERLNHMEDGIYEASTGTSIEVYNDYNTSTTDSYSCNYVNGLNTYSTTEQIIGKWIDNKNIYRKVVQTTIGATTNSWTKIVDLPIDTLIRKDGFFVSGTDKYPIERSYNNEEMTIYYNQNGIYEMHNYSYANNKDATLILEYTKTTD